MDQIIIWGVIWFAVLLSAIPVLGLLGGVISVGVTADPEYGAFGMLVGWGVGFMVSVYAIVQVILHIAHLIQFLTGVA